MKDIMLSIGTLAMWWAVGYTVQTAAKVMSLKEAQPVPIPTGSKSGQQWEVHEPQGHVGIRTGKLWDEAA